MRFDWIVTACALPGVLALAGCGDEVGGQIPPSKGGDEARKSIEYPFGTPKNLKAMKLKKARGVPDQPAVKTVH